MPIRSLAGAIALTALVVACGGKQEQPEETPPATPALTPGDTNDLVRVRFARGSTSGIVNDSLQEGESRGYLLGAARGQVMLVHAITWAPRPGTATPAPATVQVFSLDDGSELKSPAAQESLWSGRLPASGDYVVRVSASAPLSYTLAMQIPRRLNPGAAGPTASIVGAAPSRAPVDYIVQGDEGQTLAAMVSERDRATLHIYGLDRGDQIAPLAERRKEWSGKLPSTQDYIVSVVPVDEGANYELTVTVR